jgi:hypothetical protein
MTTYEVPREQLDRMGYRTNAERARAPASTIARAVEIEELTVRTGVEEGNAVMQPAEAGAAAGAQITVEKLARKVYDKIRTRLRIERERSGLSSGVVSR